MIIRINVFVSGKYVAAWDVEFDDSVDMSDPMFVKTMLETEDMLLEQFIHTEWKILTEEEIKKQLKLFEDKDESTL